MQLREILMSWQAECIHSLYFFFELCLLYLCKKNILLHCLEQIYTHKKSKKPRINIKSKHMHIFIQHLIKYDLIVFLQFPKLTFFEAIILFKDQNHIQDERFDISQFLIIKLYFLQHQIIFLFTRLLLFFWQH